ncbi:MAG: hypothetical protein ACI9BW_000221 [Gammaproteobacteria bacterium]|jgi:hypothetical protein
MALEGECLCGAIGYRISGELINPRSCHCSRCRKAFSGAGSAYAEVDSKTFVWSRGETELTIYGKAQGFALGFCRLCGSTLCGLYCGDIHGITLGSLIGDPGIIIEKHIFVDSKASWDMIGGDAPQFSQGLNSAAR